jgi:hypothetical protein
MSNLKEILMLTLQKKIPIYLIKYIYEEFFEADIVYKQLINVIDCKDSQKLKTDPLFKFTQIIFHKNKKNSTIIPYICKNHEIFAIYYKDHYIDIIKHFIKMDTDHSFVACILMSLYH